MYYGGVSVCRAQLRQKAARDRNKAAGQANERETFTCGVCLDSKALRELELNVPCGHGLCTRCATGQRQATAGKAPECHTCRGQIASVVRTFV